MITGLRGATLWSEDVNNLLPIYQDVVGLPVAVDAPGFALGTNTARHAAATAILPAHDRPDDRRHHSGREAF